jgi:hypothetical protein
MTKKLTIQLDALYASLKPLKQCSVAQCMLDSVAIYCKNLQRQIDKTNRESHDRILSAGRRFDEQHGGQRQQRNTGGPVVDDQDYGSDSS